MMHAVQSRAEVTLGHENARRRAVKTAEQFESILVRQMVSGMRESAKIGDSDSMFGSGVGSGTYGDWFDQHLAEHISDSNQLGIKEAILDGIARAGQLPGEPSRDTSPVGEDITNKVRVASLAASQASLMAAISKGGIDVTQ